jgi:hypothetical protein
MGAWNEDGTAWLPRDHYPTRGKARAFYSSHTGASFTELSVIARYARHAPDEPGAEEFDGEYCFECARDELGAFPVWRVE